MPWAIPVHNFYEQRAFVITLFPSLIHNTYLYSGTGPPVEVPQISQENKPVIAADWEPSFFFQKEKKANKKKKKGKKVRGKEGW